MSLQRARRAAPAVVLLGVILVVSGCASTSFPDAPETVGEGFPGTCAPNELTWPSDFLDGLSGERWGVGSVLGLRLDYVGEKWVWRVRTNAERTDVFGEQIDDSTAGTEVIMDVRTLERLDSRSVTLTEAEQTAPVIGAWSAVKEAGETWPGPLVVDLRRVDGASWLVTLCDTEAGTLSTMTVQ